VTLRCRMAIAGGLLVVLSAIRVATGARDITSSGAVRSALELAMPIMLAGLGGLWSERAGVANIGLEGMMILGTWFGAYAGVTFGPWWGVLAGAAGGAVGGGLHALATVTFGVDQIVSGVAINLLGGGIARYLSVLAYQGRSGGGGATQSPQVGEIGRWRLPWITGGLSDVERFRWFIVSDVAGIVRGLVDGVSPVTVLALALVGVTVFVLWRTPFGLRLRACGEAPLAAESLGVNVYRMKYAAVIISGAFAGLGGAFLSLIASSIYREGQTAGRGFIGLAAMIFGNWRPGGLAAGAALFGYADALQLRQAESIRVMLLFAAVLLAAVAVRQLRRRKPLSMVANLVFATALLWWFLHVDVVPGQLVSFTPHLTTLLVLGLASQRLRPPAADGVPYRRGGGG
jgi:general nucleoside transport system permease protein